MSMNSGYGGAATEGAERADRIVPGAETARSMHAVRSSEVAQATDISPRTARLGLTAVFAAGLLLRLSTIASRGLWLDEAVTVRQTSGTLWKAISTQIEGVHPPLFHILMHYWVTLWGTSELAIRSFALAFGMAAILAAYWAGRNLYDRRTALAAAGVAAFAPYLIWYSQEARMYAMLLFFAFLSVGCLHGAVTKNRFRDWAGYAVTTLLGLFTHYFFMVLFAGEVLFFLSQVLVRGESELGRAGRAAFSWRAPWRIFRDVPQLAPWSAAMIMLLSAEAAWMFRSILFTPDNPLRGTAELLSTATSTGLGYGQVGPSLALRFNDVVQVVVEIAIGFHAPAAMYGLVAAWPLVVCIGLIMLDYSGPSTGSTKLLFFAASGIPLLWLLGQWQGQVLASRYFIALAAPVVLLLGRVIARMRPRVRTPVLAAAICLLLIAWFDQSFDPANIMRYDNRDAISYIAASYRPGDTFIYEPFYTSDLVDYYLPDRSVDAYAFPMMGDGGRVRSGKAELAQDLDRVAGGSQRVWLMLSFQNIAQLRGDAYNTTKWFTRNGYRIAQNIQLNQVQIIRFERVAPDRFLPLGSAR